MEKSLQVLDSRLLRAAGKVQGKRPFVSIRQTALKIKPPDINSSPKPPVDAVLIFGMGPVHLSLIKGFLHHKNVALGQSRMKHNAIASLELAARGFVKKEGLIIPSGTATADPELVEATMNLKHDDATNWDALMALLELKAANKDSLEATLEKPGVKELASKIFDKEIQKLYKISEAQLMEWLFLKGHSKVMRPDGKARTTGKSTGLEVFVENQATETIENFIHSINELDKRSRREHRKLFDGSIAAVTSRYHIARTMETARYLGLENQVIPLVSQEVLKNFGYDTNLFKSGDEFDMATRWNEQKWTRALHQVPEYVLPILTQIHDDERLLNALLYLLEQYGREVFQKFDLTHITIENISQLRIKLKEIVRKNPRVQKWMKTDVKEINDAINLYIKFTDSWIAANTPIPVTP
jgi:hypothetical protein